MKQFSHYALEWLKVLAEFMLYLIIGAGVAIGLIRIAQLVVGSEFSGVTEPEINPYHGLLTEYLPLLIGAIVSLYLTHTLILKRQWSLTGFIKRNWLKEFGMGGLLAFVMLCIGFLILWITKLIRIDDIDWQPWLFLGFFLFFLIQSSFEEVLSRAFLIPMIENRFGVWLGLIVSSLFFTLLHGANPNVNWVGLINIFLAGLLLGMLFVRFRSIWAPIGLHVFWNFLQGTVFGYEVSGLEVYSLLNTTETGNDYLTGGSFGYEGSLLALVSLLIGCLLVYIEKPNAFRTLAIYSQAETKREIHV